MSLCFWFAANVDPSEWADYVYASSMFLFCFFKEIIFYLSCVCYLTRTGSENNSLYLYYKGLSKTLLTFKFDTVKTVLDKDKKEDDTNEFVSAVCWRALPDGVSLPNYRSLSSCA